METDLGEIKVVCNYEIEDAKAFAEKVCAEFYNSKLTDKKPEIFSLDNLSEIFGQMDKIGLIVAIGGDGTLLKCARTFSKFNIPVFGFNMGRLGYLSQALPCELEYVIEKFKNNDFRIENRLMLKSNTGNIALNDMVIRKETNARTSVLDLFINDKPVCSYMADGLIISTPTGSTAYALSAGGPVVAPDINCFTIVPICPHTLTARPVVVNSDETLVIKICENEGYQITADGQETKTFKGEIKIQKNENSAKLLLLNKGKDEFYRVLREKLHWGVAPNKC